MVMKKKNLGIELLRIVAMMMVVVLHYLDKGGILQPYMDNMEPSNLFYWLLEAFALESVNVYILITGYLLADAAWKPKRLFQVVLQVYFYTILIPVVLILAGLVAPGSITLYDWIRYLFPVGQECYWYISAYAVMIVFSPILAAGAKSLTKKQFQGVLAILLFLFSVEKTVFPIAFSTDRYGYDFGWLLCLFLVAVYLKLHGIPFLEKGCRNGFLLYVVSCLGMWFISIGSGCLGRMGLATFGLHYVSRPYDHNYLLTLTASVGVFYGFKNLKFREPEDGKQTIFTKLVLLIGPHVMGVYLLHEHPVLNYRWPAWLGVIPGRSVPLMLVHMLACVLLIFTCGVVIDLMRARLYRFVGTTFFRKRKTS